MRNPNTIDVRDETLGSMLERSAEGIEATRSDRLPEVIRRGSRRRVGRFGAISAAVAVFVGAVSWAGLSLPADDAVIPANVSDWRTFASLEDNGWTIQVPPPWHVLELPGCRGAADRIGVMVTNVEFDFRDPQGGPPDCGDRLLFAGFPRNGVALTFMPIVGDSLPGLFFLRQPNTVLPLAPQLLEQSGGIRGGPAESSQSVWLHRDRIGTVRRFVGPEAVEADVKALDRMLGSFEVAGAPHWIAGSIRAYGEIRITLSRPDNWRATPFMQLQVIDAPTPVMKLTSPGVGEGPCRSFPGAPWLQGDRLSGGFEEFDAVIVLSDATDSWQQPELPPRPDGFRFVDATDDKKACGGAVRTVRFGFEAVGRPYFLDVAASTAVFREQAEMLRYILDSIEISKAN